MGALPLSAALGLAVGLILASTDAAGADESFAWQRISSARSPLLTLVPAL